jgi:two-component system nitrogen regulation response regulator GlnG
VRQLQNLCHWLTLMAPSATIEVDDLPAEFRSGGEDPRSHSWAAALGREVQNALARGEKNLLDGYTREFEKAMITKALAHTGGRRIEAANLLGMGRNTLTRKIQELGLDKPASE